jgi:hypothetical protein
MIQQIRELASTRRRNLVNSSGEILYGDSGILFCPGVGMITHILGAEYWLTQA